MEQENGITMARVREVVAAFSHGNQCPGSWFVRRQKIALWRHVREILLLPGVVLVAIPAVILYFTGVKWPPSVVSAIGLAFFFAGVALMAATNQLFIMFGQGTLAPFDPPETLVVEEIYRHVRNPMMLGVFCILLGEAIFFISLPLLALLAVGVIVNLIYIPLVEEPGLVKRFGEDYLRYKANVPRWIPRLRPWVDHRHGAYRHEV